MPELNLEEVQEVPVPEKLNLPFPPPPIEEVVHFAHLNVNKVQTPQGTLTLLQFLTPFKTYTFKLDDDAAKLVSDAIRPSGIKVANLGDLRAVGG